MEDVVVSVKELLKKVNELIADNIEFVELGIMPESEFEGHIFPKCITFLAFNGEGGGVDFESIDHQEVSSTYKWD